MPELEQTSPEAARIADPIEDIQKLRPSFTNPEASAEAFESALLRMEVELEQVSAEHGPGSEQAEALRRKLNHLRYVK